MTITRDYAIYPNARRTFYAPKHAPVERVTILETLESGVSTSALVMSVVGNSFPGQPTEISARASRDKLDLRQGTSRCSQTVESCLGRICPPYYLTYLSSSLMPSSEILAVPSLVIVRRLTTCAAVRSFLHPPINHARILEYSP